jgi:predicted nucleic acid-binding protein
VYLLDTNACIRILNETSPPLIARVQRHDPSTLKMSRTSRYALRLPASLLDEVKRVARGEGTTMNQSISVAVAEKTAALRTAAYFRQRRRRGNLGAFDRILAEAGSEPPRPGDELPNKRARRRLLATS